MNGRILFNRRLQLLGAAMRPALDLPLGQIREPALHLVDPRGTRRRQVQVEVRMHRQPGMEHRGLVRAVVGQHQVDLEVRRHGLVQ